jgi:hypothetical protein
MTRIVTTHLDLPARVGPAEFSTLGAMVVVRCPHDLDPLMRKAGGLWEPGAGTGDPSGTDGAADPQSAPRHRSAVPAGRHEPGRGGWGMSDRQTLARATGIPHEKAESLATATARFVEGSAATKADLERTEAGPRSRPTSTASNSA